MRAALMALLLLLRESSLGTRLPPPLDTPLGGIDFNDTNSERSYNRIKAYTQSKYAVLLYV